MINQPFLFIYSSSSIFTTGLDNDEKENDKLDEWKDKFSESLNLYPIKIESEYPLNNFRALPNNKVPIEVIISAPENPIIGFEMTRFPGNCGILVFSSFSRNQNFIINTSEEEKKRFYKVLSDFFVFLGEINDYGMILMSHNDIRKDFIRMVKNNSWCYSKLVYNPNSKNKIFIAYKLIGKS